MNIQQQMNRVVVGILFWSIHAVSRQMERFNFGVGLQQRVGIRFVIKGLAGIIFGEWGGRFIQALNLIYLNLPLPRLAKSVAAGFDICCTNQCLSS